LIDTKDVIKLLIPFPNIDSKLAVQAHMYICIDKSNVAFEFVKCDKLVIGKDIKFKRYVLTKPNIQHNPFIRTTIIDCDKTFTTTGIHYPKSLLTTKRKDISEDLYREIMNTLENHQVFHINKNELFLVDFKVKEFNINHYNSS